uniref:DUF4220 domain-containing protein n=1 Tax=Setaria digitata TaxID=48799 RepID=A0A915PK50_9BILA
MIGVASSDFLRRVYKLILNKSLLDVMDLEMIEEQYLVSEQKTLISSKVGVSLIVICFSVITVVVASGFSVSYQVLGLLVCPALFIGFLEIIKWFCYYIILSYIEASTDFDSIFHRIIALIRSREITFFGLWQKFDLNAAVCLRSLRSDLLKALRCAVQCHIRMSRSLSSYDDSGKLLCEMFTPEISRLALEDDICEKFLQLHSLKLLFLLRSEYLRLFLVNLSYPPRTVMFLFLDLLWGILLLKNSKASLSGNEIPEEKKFQYVGEILKKALEFSTPETHVQQHEDIEHPSISSDSLISGNIYEAESTADDLRAEKIYEGSSLVSDDEQKDVFPSSWEEDKTCDLIAKSVVMELKLRLLERVKESDATTAAESSRIERMAKVKNKCQEIPTVCENCSADKYLVDDQNTLDNITLLSENNILHSRVVGMDLKHALSFMKLAPSVDFIDDPGNE